MPCSISMQKKKYSCLWYNFRQSSTVLVTVLVLRMSWVPFEWSAENLFSGIQNLLDHSTGRLRSERTFIIWRPVRIWMNLFNVCYYSSMACSDIGFRGMQIYAVTFIKTFSSDFFPQNFGIPVNKNKDPETNLQHHASEEWFIF